MKDLKDLLKVELIQCIHNINFLIECINKDLYCEYFKNTLNKTIDILKIVPNRLGGLNVNLGDL